ncbi:hypothetical protein SAMN05421734_11025 [Pelagirhabdus alkalitolerans]|uniref:Uncharacterized protein n=1 Tax=Pelagirhabdus alkalitolerans TaxID=1612202 RepID=A0A1G6M422_9BACI|nr:hypothetical protein [Pelagirhabdus alkalitolerans]SDC50249.1 hypothetical protein SAMN05421734_11025 [Pelagirhabdus alkalitolerans]
MRGYSGLLRNFYREKMVLIEDKTASVLPELKGLVQFILPFYFLLQIPGFFIPLIIDLSRITYIQYVLGHYLVESLLLCLAIHLFISLQILNFRYENKCTSFFGRKLMIPYILLRNYNTSVSWVYAQALSFSIFHVLYFFIILPFSIMSMFVSVHHVVINDLQKKKMIKKIYSFLLIGIIMIVGTIILYKEQAVFDHVIGSLGDSRGSALSMTFLFFIWNYFVSKQNMVNVLIYNPFTTQTNSRLFNIPWIQYGFNISVLFFTNMFEKLNDIQGPLFILSFLVVCLLQKRKHIQLLTIESFGNFLFYLKQIRPEKGVTLLKKVEKNNYMLLLPIFLYTNIWFIINQEFTFILLTGILFVLDVELDNFLILVFRKVLDTNELKNLFLVTIKGLSTVILIAFIPINLVLFYINEISPRNIVGGMLIPLSTLLICTWMIKHYWSQGFFNDLYKT